MQAQPLGQNALVLDLKFATFACPDATAIMELSNAS